MNIQRQLTTCSTSTSTESSDNDQICALDEIAWLLNLRGSDIPYNPVFYAFLVVFRHRAAKPILYCDVDKVTDALGDHSSIKTVTEQICFRPYTQIEKDLRAMRDGPKWSVWMNRDQCPHKLVQQLTTGADTVATSPRPGQGKSPADGRTPSSGSTCYVYAGGEQLPIAGWKAVKNEV